MMKNTGKKAQQIKKAEQFLALHHDPELLVLPNIWDPIGARLLQGQGYPAVATASAAVAFSLGYHDGQKITLAAMIEAVRRVADSVDVPVTADMEGGYAEQPKDVAENMHQVLHVHDFEICTSPGAFARAQFRNLHQLFCAPATCTRSGTSACAKIQDRGLGP